MVYRFRVTYEDHEDVFRDIEIRSSQSFLELHAAIQQAISFDNSKSASFYMSDDYWRKEEEISVENTNEKKTKKTKSKREESGNKKTIADLVNDPHQKFIYVFDPEKEWTFLIELIKIIPENKTISYPQCVKSSGTAPKQYKPTNLPPPPAEEDTVLPLMEKEIIIDAPEEKISVDDVEEGAILLDEEDVKTGEEGEGGAEDEAGEESEEFDID
ncbi:MAG: hypothetical protein HY840_03745 [Bacteroidetes bacterium]|nr:hypothetical protein [Bacteroidota bacterium]